LTDYKIYLEKMQSDIQCQILQKLLPTCWAFIVMKMVFDGMNIGHKGVESVLPCIPNCGSLPIWNGNFMDGVSAINI